MRLKLKAEEGVMHKWGTSDGSKGITGFSKEEFKEVIRKGIKLIKWERI